MKALVLHVYKRQHIIVYVFCCMFLLYETVVQISFSCIAKEFLSDLSLNKQTLSVLSASYFLSYAFFQIVMAHWINRFSFRSVFVVSTCTLAFAIYCCSQSASLLQACLARFLMGASSSSAFILLVNATKKAFKKSHLTLFLGVSQLFSATFVVIFQLQIARLCRVYNFRSVLEGLSFFGIIFFILVYLSVKSDENESARVDFSFIETLRGVLGEPRILKICMYSFFLWGPVVGMSALWGPYFLAQKMHGSHQDTIFVSSLIFLGLAVSSPIIGAFCIHEKYRQKVLLWCPILAFLSAVGFWVVPKCSVFVAAFFMISMGMFSAAYEVSYALIRQVFHDHRANVATALNNMASIASVGVFQVIVGLLMTVSQDQIKVALVVPILFYAAATYISQRLV